MKGKRNIDLAKKAKKDCFYTQLSDIQNELDNYKEHFKDKVICCPCDETAHTKFYEHFCGNIETYKWKKLICVGYDTKHPTKAIIVENVNGEPVATYKDLVGNGDFRNKETIELMEQSDIIVTNPPFSLFREFMALLTSLDKKYIILGNQNAISYQEIFPLFRDNKMWAGYSFNKVFEFKVEDGYSYNRIDEKGNKYGRVPGICWFTNLDIEKREVFLDTNIDFEFGSRKFNYKKYDNYDALNVDKVKQIPMDYDGIMGVPITFLDKYNPKQYRIIGLLAGGNNKDIIGIEKTWDKSEARGVVDGKLVYARLLIQKI